jgi:hypothetical protein
MAGMLWSNTPQPNSHEHEAELTWDEIVERIVNRLAHGDSVSTCAMDLGLDVELATESPLSPRCVAEQLEAIRLLPISLKFTSNNPQHLAIPRYPHVHAVQEVVRALAAKLRCLAERQPDLVRDSICFYTQHVYTENILVMRSDQDAHNFREFVTFLHKLKVAPRTYGFGDFDPSVLRPKLVLIGLPPRTCIYPRKAHNKQSCTASKHLGLGVVRQLCHTSGEISCEAFRYTMALAAIAQLWKFGEDDLRNRLPPSLAPDTNLQGAFGFAESISELPE